jgi:hypothetical protein
MEERERGQVSVWDVAGNWQQLGRGEKCLVGLVCVSVLVGLGVAMFYGYPAFLVRGLRPGAHPSAAGHTQCGGLEAWAANIAQEDVVLPALTQTRERTSRFTMAVLILLGLSLCPLVLVGGFAAIWLAGIVFGYGWGLLLATGGTTVGMTLPFLRAWHRPAHTHTPLRLDQRDIP